MHFDPNRSLCNLHSYFFRSNSLNIDRPLHDIVNPSDCIMNSMRFSLNIFNGIFNRRGEELEEKVEAREGDNDKLRMLAEAAFGGYDRSADSLRKEIPIVSNVRLQ